MIESGWKVRGGEVELICSDAEEMAIKDNSFDCITAGELIEHLENPEKFIKECKRILKQGGVLIITTPNKKSWWNRITKAYEHKYHKNLFDINSIKHFLIKNGFDIADIFLIPYDKY